MAESIPQLLQEIVHAHPEIDVQLSKDAEGVFRATSYRDFYVEVATFAAGLQSIGVSRGNHVGMISDNRKEWLIADFAILGLGAADVPRGCDSMEHEIAYILGVCECAVAIAENEKQVEKIHSRIKALPKLQTIIVFDAEFVPERKASTFPNVKLLTFQDVMEIGRPIIARQRDLYDREVALGKREDLATIIFTSGTTGEPKGVMLTHDNYLFQIKAIPERIFVKPADIWLSVLPVWHSFERIVQYVIIGTASTMAYSKPVGQIMLADFATVRPMWMSSVPRIWESVQAGVYRNVKTKSPVARGLFHFFVSVGGAYATMRNMILGLTPRFRKRNKVIDAIVALIPFALLAPFRALGELLVFKSIKERLGGRFVAALSGGGALPHSVDMFFQATGVLLLEGYGLTETGPVLGVRPQNHPVPNTIGPPLPDTFFRVVDDERHDLPPGRKGVVLAKGGQLMRGYFKRDDLTKRIISDDGWLDTGDLGMLTWDGELRIMGRAKDTIVLLGGENIEPAPMEERLRESPYIAQAVVLGQDQKYLAALIVPKMDALVAFAEENSIPFPDPDGLANVPEINELIDGEIASLVSAKNGFKSFERIYRFKIIPHEFSVGRELSHKQEVMRHAINELFKKEIQELFAKA